MLQVLNYQNNDLEIVQLNDEVLFNVKQLGEILEIVDVNSTIRSFEEGFDKIKITNKILQSSEMHNMHIRKLNNAGETFLTESGLYMLAFKSRKESAKQFTKWVTREVLPQIRKTGSYSTNPQPVLPTSYKEAIQHLLVQLEKTEQLEMENKKQEKQIEHKNDVISGLVEDVDLTTKRQRITQIIRCGEGGDYQKRYNLLYKEYELKYHIDLNRRMKSQKTLDIKPKIKSKMDYIDRVLNGIPNLYEIACVLFETDIDLLKEDWEITRG